MLSQNFWRDVVLLYGSGDKCRKFSLTTVLSKRLPIDKHTSSGFWPYFMWFFLFAGSLTVVMLCCHDVTTLDDDSDCDRADRIGRPAKLQGIIRRRNCPFNWIITVVNGSCWQITVPAVKHLVRLVYRTSTVFTDRVSVYSSLFFIRNCNPRQQQQCYQQM